MARKAKPAQPQDDGAPNINNMQFWRGVARQFIDDSNKWHQGEVAVAFKLLGDVIGKEWGRASRLGDKAENSTLSLSVNIKISRKETPPSVVVSLGYSEKHSQSAASDVPDLDQTELPGISEPKARAEMKVPDVELEGVA
jgi:hypothetical protein